MGFLRVNVYGTGNMALDVAFRMTEVNNQQVVVVEHGLQRFRFDDKRQIGHKEIPRIRQSASVPCLAWMG